MSAPEAPRGADPLRPLFSHVSVHWATPKDVSHHFFQWVDEQYWCSCDEGFRTFREFDEHIADAVLAALLRSRASTPPERERLARALRDSVGHSLNGVRGPRDQGGFTAACDCGWEGPVREAMDAAYQDAALHQADAVLAALAAGGPA